MRDSNCIILGPSALLRIDSVEVIHPSIRALRYSGNRCWAIILSRQRAALPYRRTKLTGSQVVRVGNAGGLICSTVLLFQSRAAQLSQARLAPA